MDYFSYLLSEAVESAFQLVGTEKKTPSLFEAGYNLELSPHPVSPSTRAIPRRAMTGRLIWKVSLISGKSARDNWLTDWADVSTRASRYGFAQFVAGARFGLFGMPHHLDEGKLPGAALQRFVLH